MCLPGQPPAAPATAGEALSAISAGLDYLNAADVASLTSAEQAPGIDQINKALMQLDETTQQNSALVEENAATAKTLEHQSSEMSERVSIFNVDQAEASPPPAVRAA